MSDCGPACIRMLSAYYGKKHSLRSIKDSISVSRIGVTVGDVRRACERLGLEAVVVQATAGQLSKISSPAILHWRGNHFVVLYKVKDRKGEKIYHIADPAYGRIIFKESDFARHWCGDAGKGIAILTTPTDAFFEKSVKKEDNSAVLKQLLHKISRKKKLLICAVAFMLIAMGCNWLSPLIFQRIIDHGVLSQNISIVWKLFIAQLAIFMGYVVSNGVNLSLIHI